MLWQVPGVQKSYNRIDVKSENKIIHRINFEKTLSNKSSEPEVLTNMQRVLSAFRNCDTFLFLCISIRIEIIFCDAS